MMTLRLAQPEYMFAVRRIAAWEVLGWLGAHKIALAPSDCCRLAAESTYRVPVAHDQAFLGMNPEKASPCCHKRMTSYLLKAGRV